jgi:quercetin dioxygenase-like cupin family protein
MGEGALSNFKLIAQGVDVSALAAELQAQPDLWNSYQYRTQAPDSPHHGVDDIWVRWRSKDDEGSPVDPHFAVDWPAWHALPALHPIVRNLSHVVDARFRGGILITQTPPGGEVKTHIDHGWHAEFFTTKLYLVLWSNPRCFIHCDGEEMSCRAGDVLSYPNNVPHGVRNEGATPHCNAIICFRGEG